MKIFLFCTAILAVPHRNQLVGIAVFCILLFLAPAALADTIFPIPAQDQSVFFLKWLFGEVGDVLEGRTDNILRGMLLYFNSALLALGGVIIIYSLVVSTINTANEGEMLGRQWSSVWIPLRAAVGFGLMLPVKGGYAVIQVFVMWIIMQGIGMADAAWIYMIDKIQTGEVAIPGATNMGVYESAQSIFVSQVCMREITRQTGRSQEMTQDTTIKRLNFGVTSMVPAEICGYVKYTDDATENAAITEMVTSLGSIADQYVPMLAVTGSLTSAQMASVQTDIQTVADNFSATMEAAARSASSGEMDKYDDALAMAKSGGWIYAGSYFLILGQIANDYVAKTSTGPGTGMYKQESIEGQLSETQGEAVITTLKYTQDDVSTPEALKLGNPSMSSVFSALWDSGLNQVGVLFAQLLSLITRGMTGWDNGSPIQAIQTFGHILQGIAIVAYGTFSTIMLITITASSVASAVNPGAWTAAGFLSIVLMPISVLIGIIFIQGLIMAFYIPMIPFIVYTVAAIGWLIVVIEAMVAAPLMALGILHPEGQHPIFGHAYKGIMILTGAFLRPMLMLVGYFAALLLVYVVVFLISVGFIPASVMATEANPIGIFVMIALYTMLIMIGFNKAFSLIYVIPDRLLRWIGEPAESSVSEQEVQSMRGAAESTGGKMSEGAQKGTQGAMTVGRQAQAALERKRGMEETPPDTGKITGKK